MPSPLKKYKYSLDDDDDDDYLSSAEWKAYERAEKLAKPIQEQSKGVERRSWEESFACLVSMGRVPSRAEDFRLAKWFTDQKSVARCGGGKPEQLRLLERFPEWREHMAKLKAEVQQAAPQQRAAPPQQAVPQQAEPQQAALKIVWLHLLLTWLDQLQGTAAPPWLAPLLMWHEAMPGSNMEWYSQIIDWFAQQPAGTVPPPWFAPLLKWHVATVNKK